MPIHFKIEMDPQPNNTTQVRVVGINNEHIVPNAKVTDVIKYVLDAVLTGHG